MVKNMNTTLAIPLNVADNFKTPESMVKNMNNTLAIPWYIIYNNLIYKSSHFLFVFFV